VIARLALAVLALAVSLRVVAAETADSAAAPPVVAGQAAAQPSSAKGPSGEEAQADELYAAPTRADRSGRILAAVLVNGRGPYRFILDTGANSSALAPRVVEELALPAAEGVQVHGVTGTAMLPAVRVESMSAGDVVLPPTVLPVLPGDIFGGADGILGVSGMQQMRIDVDFAHDHVSIYRSGGRHATSGYVTVKASLWQGGLLLVAGKVGSIPTHIIIDTGAERTMGNLPLRAAILARSKPGEEFATTVRGATTDIGAGTYFRAPQISVGPAKLVDLLVTFGDLHVFDLWGLTDEPALVIGMDVLGRLERFIVDYRLKEFQIKTRGARDVAIRRCTSSTCASRIPEYDPR
jgi:hypothetical protein